MKNLNQFLAFDLERFLCEKELTVAACMPWVDFATKAKLGTRIEVAITRDDTPYTPSKDGGVATNLFEKLSIKVGKDISIPVGSSVTIVGGRASVYGDFRNQLSIRAEDVKIVDAPTAKGGKD